MLIENVQYELNSSYYYYFGGFISCFAKLLRM